MSLVFDATSRSICAPIFSNLSASSISLATVTPSLVIRGAPKDLSRTTLRPLGPSVTLTALARMSTPRSSRSRASPWNFTSLAAMLCYFLFLRGNRGLGDFLGGFRGRTAFDDPHNVGFFHDHELFAVDLDLGPRPFAEEHPVTRPDIERMKHAILAPGSGADRDHLALLRFFFGGVRDDDPARRFLLLLQAPDHDAVVQGTEIHGNLLRVNEPDESGC